MNPQQLAVLAAAGALLLMVVLLVVYGRPRRAETEPAPANFHKGDPDAVLEGPRLQKLQTWGFATSVFIAGFLAVYFVAEPFRQTSKKEAQLEESIHRGDFIYGPEEGADANCASCHGPGGEGGRAATNVDWPAPPLNNVFQRMSKNEVRRIIKMGRAGTPMPVWGLEFGGPLNDQKIEDVVNYVESFQVEAGDHWELAAEVTGGREIYEEKCAVCHGRDAKGQSMGVPLPTFYAPDLTTEYYRLGVDVLEQRGVDAASASQADILAAGEEAVRNTLNNGRANTPMPAWKQRIRPEQVDAVMGYLRSIQRRPS